MVTEVLKETEVTQPEAEATPTPELTPEPVSTPEADDNDDASLDATLAELGFGDTATESSDGKGAAANETVPSIATLTPEQAFEEGKKSKEAETKQASQAYQNQAYIQGVQRSFAAVADEIDTKADVEGWSLETKKWVKDRFAQHNGHWSTLHTAATTASEEQLRQSYNLAFTEEGIKRTGNKDFVVKSIPEYIDTIVAHEIATKGYKTAAEVKEATIAAQRALLKRIRDGGGDIPGDRVLNVGSARSGGGVASDNAKLSDPNTPLAEIESIRARQRRADG